ncbi:NmrA family NAD(P)-binding protein [Sorangium atrum]|uniref:NmrA family NAD(P)-binding protein n=1 Tax=Sorangium atrum TaxID=2995308 RepID=A0ABT5BWP9_9BACT|nr:NmrA family NAD(P)-binding protein [Sorangium aterium]MDC0678566.1 NmrA family NAD(P)-binding protein [Sorangium aterium]
MTTKERLVLVTGATGQQGGGAARALLSRGVRVRALVRNPQGEPAAALRRLGAEVVGGDLGDRASLEAAARGADAVFSVQPSEGQPQYGVTSEDEARFGKNVADAARAARVRHLVYTSMAGLEPGTGVGHFESKWQIETYVRSLDVPFTILRPGAFFELLTQPQFYAAPGKFTFFYPPEHRIPFIAAEDIGAIAAAVLAAPDAFAGRTLELGGDVLTGVETAAALGRATGQPLAYARFPAEALRENTLFERIVEAALKLRVDIDVASLRALHPTLKTLATWLEEGGAARIPVTSRSGAQ